MKNLSPNMLELEKALKEDKKIDHLKKRNNPDLPRNRKGPDGLTLGERITYLRKKEGYSQKNIQELTGIDAAVYGRYEINDKDLINLDYILKLAKLFDVSPSFLLGLSEPLAKYPTEIFAFIQSEDGYKYVAKAYAEYLADKQGNRR